MNSEDRRGFIKKLAKGAVYVSPIVVSMTAPADLLGQGKSSQHKHHHGHHHGHGPPMSNVQSPFPPPPGD